MPMFVPLLFSVNKSLYGFYNVKYVTASSKCTKMSLVTGVRPDMRTGVKFGTPSLQEIVGASKLARELAGGDLG